jgi:ferredoxin
MKVAIDEDVCIGCGLCSQICPEVFKMKGDRAVVYHNPVPDDCGDTCRQAASDCPVTAIRVEED